MLKQNARILSVLIASLATVAHAEGDESAAFRPITVSVRAQGLTTFTNSALGFEFAITLAEHLRLTAGTSVLDPEYSNVRVWGVEGLSPRFRVGIADLRIVGGYAHASYVFDNDCNPLNFIFEDSICGGSSSPNPVENDVGFAGVEMVQGRFIVGIRLEALLRSQTQYRYIGEVRRGVLEKNPNSSDQESNFIPTAYLAYEF